MQQQLFTYICACVLVFSAINAVNGACKECSVATDLACISQTEFQVCINGTPLGDIASCPSGYVCSTLGTTICQLNGTNVLGDCADCNVCDAGGNFACTGLQTYALCLNTTTPSSLTGSCAPNHICSIEFEQICVNVSSGIFPSCNTGGQGVTTQAPINWALQKPQTYCKELRQYGRFPVGRDILSTCRKYVFCFLTNGNWSGAVYTCPGRTYFDSSTRLCHDYVPLDCY